jgi:hypothetical protein
MLMRGSISSVTLIGVLCATLNGAWALDETKYPNWKGQWVRADSAETAPWDARKPRGLGQQPPLTPEYQAIFEANLKQLAAGVTAGDRTVSDPTVRCIPAAMPRVMMAIHPMEIVILPDTTYIMIETSSTLRRVFTDGRAWPKEREPSYAGFSIGHWEDTDRDGRFDTLAIETRWIKGPHSYDDSGIPLHADEQAVIKERISLDPRDPRLLLNEITTFDNALTRPWTVTQSYRRAAVAQPAWTERVCSEDGQTIRIGEEDYALSDGLLMPVRKGQPPPDLRYFNQEKNQN